jgi:hypothetical protein
MVYEHNGQAFTKFGSIHLCTRDTLFLQKAHTSKIFLREHTEILFWVHFNLFRVLTCMQDVIFDLTWQSSQKTKLVLVARLVLVSPYNI